MSFLVPDEDKNKKQKQEELDKMRKERRDNYVQGKLDDYNKSHSDKKAVMFHVPNKLTFEQFKQSHVFPYRSPYKLKSIYDNFKEVNLLNELSLKDIYNLSPHYNNYNIKENQKKYNLKTYSNIRYSFIGDIFFQSNKAAYLLLINVNTRFAYAYQLGKYDLHEIKGYDENDRMFVVLQGTKGIKTIDSLTKAFREHLKVSPVNVLTFDGEKAIQSKDFKKLLKDNNIKLISVNSNSHTSLSLIDRLSRTLRDIAFNLGLNEISGQEQMNLILYYYNTTRHDTLTKIIFSSHPELKKNYPLGITPYDVNNNPELEKIYVIECKKYNFYIKSKPDYEIKEGETVKVVNDYLPFEKKRTILSKDNHKVIKQTGNVYEVENLKTNKTTIKPRYKIKLF